MFNENGIKKGKHHVLKVDFLIFCSKNIYVILVF